MLTRTLALPSAVVFVPERFNTRPSMITGSRCSASAWSAGSGWTGEPVGNAMVGACGSVTWFGPGPVAEMVANSTPVESGVPIRRRIPTVSPSAELSESTAPLGPVSKRRELATLTSRWRTMKRGAPMSSEIVCEAASVGENTSAGLPSTPTMPLSTTRTLADCSGVERSAHTGINGARPVVSSLTATARMAACRLPGGGGSIGEMVTVSRSISMVRRAINRLPP